MCVHLAMHEVSYTAVIAANYASQAGVLLSTNQFSVAKCILEFRGLLAELILTNSYV